MSTPDRPPFTAELEIAASPDAVWRALATPAGTASWFAPEVEIEPRVGGALCWRWPGAHDWVQTIEVWEPGKRLVTSYDAGLCDEHGAPRPLRMEFTIEGAGGRTTLRLVHSGFGPEADFDAEYDGISRGWPIELDCLRHALERHGLAPRHLAWCVVPLPAALADDLDGAWARLTGPAELGLGVAADRLAPGSPITGVVAGERVEGRVLRTAAREVTAVATSHGDGFLRVAIERCSGHLSAWLWLARWQQDGDDPARLAAEQSALEARWRAAATALFADAASGSEISGAKTPGATPSGAETSA